MAAGANKLWTLYGLVDPQTGEIRYCGLTGKSLALRLSQHLRQSRQKDNLYKSNWISQMRQSGMLPGIISIRDGLSFTAVVAAEIAYIADNAARLTNITRGGEAVMFGRKHSHKTRRAMSETRRGVLNAFHGRRHTQESKEAISLSRRGKGGRSGSQVLEETRQKISKSLMGHIPWNKGLSLSKQSAAYKLKHSQIMREWRQKRKETLSGL